MKVSILSPVFNEEKHLAEMIASVQSQSYEDWELLMVDDGSTDRTVDVIERHAAEDPRIHLVSAGHKLGKARAYNVAYGASSGDIIVLLAGDDRWTPGSLAIRVNDLTTPDATEKRLGAYKLKSFSDDPRLDGMVLPRGPETVSFSGGVLTMSRSLAQSVFPIDESLPSEDIWLGYAAPAVADHVVRNPTVVLEYRMHEGNSNPRMASFASMSQRMGTRHQAWNLLLASGMQFEPSARTKMEGLWAAEQHRRHRHYGALMTESRLSASERLSFLAMAHPFLFTVRQRFYRLLSGRQGR